MRACLERNKIYFEIFASIALGVMAVIVSFQSNLIAKAQLQLVDESQGLTLLQHLPRIKAEFKYVDSGGGWRKEKLVIANFGDDMYEFGSFEIAFVALKELQLLHIGQKPDPSIHLKKARIPLDGYFPNIRYGVNADKGVITTLDIENVNMLDEELRRFEKLYSTNKKSLSSYVERYLMAKYRDKFMNEHIKYFKFGPAGESIPMGKDDGVKVFKEHEEKRQAADVLDFEKSTSKDINLIWLKYGE